MLTSVESSREVEKGLTIDKIITTSVPMSQLKNVVGSRQVAIALDIQLTRLVASLNLKWTVNDSQIKTIVEDLIERFPSESIEDFVLCFKKARMGEYGELMRIDSPIIFTWMKAYLDEKYTVLESKWEAKKEQLNKQIIPETEKDWLKVWQEAIDSLPHSKPKDLTDDQVKREGQVKPPPVEYNPSEVAQLEMINRHKEKVRQARRSYYLSAYPNATENDIQNYLAKFETT